MDNLLTPLGVSQRQPCSFPDKRRCRGSGFDFLAIRQTATRGIEKRRFQKADLTRFATGVVLASIQTVLGI